MKDEYDFEGAEQGKFYTPIDELDIPVYLNDEVKKFFLEKFKGSESNFSLSNIINAIVMKDIEISQKLTMGK